MTSDEGQAWARRLSHDIGLRVKQARQRANLTARELADRCERLGYRIEATALANMETGRRVNIPVAEVLVLAAALGVPPLLVLFPIQADADVEVLPERSVTAWPDAMRWFTGETPLGGLDRVERAWEDATDVLAQLRHEAAEQARLRRAVVAHTRLVTSLGKTTDEQTREALRVRVSDADELVRETERTLATTRRGMRALDVEPGSLPADLAHVDDLPEAHP